MSTPSIALLLAALAALAAPLLSQEAQEAQEAPAPAPPDVETARAARLAEDRARLEKIAAAVDRFGHVDEFAAGARKLLESATGRFVKVRDGSLIDDSLSTWLGWNVPTAPGAKPPALDFDLPGHPYTAIVDLNRQLHEHGIDFLIVTFPTRSQVYPELFLDLPSTAATPGNPVPETPVEGFAGICPGTSRFALALNAAGVEVLYLAPEFVAQRLGPDVGDNRQLFLRDNQHWTPRAAELTARLTAERLAKYPWYKPGPAREGVDWSMRERDVTVAIVYSRAPEWAKAEHHRVHQVTRLTNGEFSSVRPSSPIALMSGSFADFHGSNGCDFTTELYRFTNWPIDKINPKGGVEDKCREELRSRGKQLENGTKKIVIWLLAEQVFRVGPEWNPLPIFDR